MILNIEHIIQLSADKIRPDLYPYDSNGWNINVGYGRVNAYKALNMLRSPYVLQHHTVTGGTDYSSSSFSATFYGVTGLTDGVYYVEQHEVRKNVSYSYMDNVHVWGDGVATHGWSAANPNFGMGWCEPVGTVGATSATLHTYVYKVYDVLGHFIGWFPTTPSNAQFAYTVQGVPETHVSGVISSNTTWIGNYVVDGNVTVNSGVTLTIDPGTHVTFADGTSLTSNGVTNASGTASRPITFTGNNWGSISLSGSGANGSTFGYVNVQNNTSLSASNVSNVSIQNCTFTNSTGNAIAFSSSSGSVTNTTITNSNTNGNGIWISSSSSVDCKSNTITKTGSGLHTGAGIYYYAGSDGNATQNDISGFNFGLASVRFSSAGSHDSYYHERNNRIRNCNVGLMVGWGSYLYFGDPPPSDYMWNSIYSNTWNAKVGTTWPYQCGLVAYGNWWGASPPPSNYQVGSSSYFYFTPYLSSDPGRVLLFFSITTDCRSEDNRFQG